MKFEAHYYSETGNMESTEYSDNLYSLLRNYSVFWQNDKYKPTLWITEGNVSLRIHDFAFISFFDCIFDIAERMEKCQFIGTFIDNAFSYKDMVKTEEKDELPKTISEFAKTYGNSSSFSCLDENGTPYGWGKVLDYLGIGWRDIPDPHNRKK